VLVLVLLLLLLAFVPEHGDVHRAASRWVGARCADRRWVSGGRVAGLRRRTFAARATGSVDRWGQRAVRLVRRRRAGGRSLLSFPLLGLPRLGLVVSVSDGRAGVGTDGRALQVIVALRGGVSRNTHVGCRRAAVDCGVPRLKGWGRLKAGRTTLHFGCVYCVTCVSLCGHAPQTNAHAHASWTHFPRDPAEW